MNQNKILVEQAWHNRELLKNENYKSAVLDTISLLDQGQIRVAEQKGTGDWLVNEWVKMAILLYFPLAENKVIKAGDLSFYDKIPTKTAFDELGVRAVPTAIARYGSFVEPGAILMPSYVNIGAFVGRGTMVDTWATVGSCAQIGQHVHLAGGVGIGGVLEPPQASPNIIEDHCFIGSRCIIVEGTIIETEAVLGANVVITGSTHIIDVSGSVTQYYKGHVPARSVVIPGSYTKKFAAGEFQVPCALIIGKRKESTDKKVTLNNALREYEIGQ
ncbi:MAG: 2,3,4,5-tetrahydropyridine-2,6-dicarboxylate N-succinyltransferase [Saprospiraceae bacterium]|nr:2,3,4,5-tetrahydropyridine-2,6-dicarboxylate N-succinyltransferase [Saprospiraceae bacterium]HMW38188.1 2,3,4,5-tetrahydropyridine-2,6-dicarboxylate N-succinyltransferase [Saprospiraceae bacterium]HMX87681.1 2,3,4,5-tetrahydropyridine-2,6-dicarboxylate N-succinyltransferase [Saprospiraceae bacterium]HMZ39496.1 2,3,4,5-tetrahydropyridine-2,6-dicarboxylate N-succinyltransferase [Saprospiraceae bacterium]HNA63131.1 2,3,4,5-tetrahydropyridine-2,6-dicarboxylate N-succinyltransferase [Saprospirace